MFGKLSPVFFGSALNNFGVEPFLKSFLEMTTSPLPRRAGDRIIDPFLMVRRINISVNNLVSESKRGEAMANEQLDFFTDYEEQTKKRDAEQRRYAREKSRQNAVISIRKKFGGNAILKGMNLEDGATTIDRNKQIGGHKA